MAQSRPAREASSGPAWRRTSSPSCDTVKRIDPAQGATGTIVEVWMLDFAFQCVVRLGNSPR